jgi:cell wall-associated NlpC family hydrolase
MKAYRTAGIAIPRVAADQWQHEPHIPKGRQQPGDLVFFITNGTPDRPGHVGIVTGTNRMIVAPHTGTTVQEQPYQARRDLLGFARPTA